MKSILGKLVIFVIALLVLFVNGYGSPKKEITKTFKDVKVVRIETVSGDCVVKKGDFDEVKVYLTYSYSPEGSFEPELVQRGTRLVLSEDFRSWRGNVEGESTWSLTVPDNIKIRFSTASGDLEVEDLKAEIEAETASGDILLRNVTGEFDIQTASGDIEAEEVEGDIDFNTA